MTPTYGSFEYAQVRLAARQSRRADAAAWRRLRSTRELRHCLVSARRTGLHAWLEELPTSIDAHDIDEGLRRAFRRDVNRVAGWVPSLWAPAVSRVGDLPDVALSSSAAEDAKIWSEQWRNLWPRTSLTERRSMNRLLSVLTSHLDVMANAPLSADGWVLRTRLAGDLLRIFRRSAGQPAAVFSYLGLSAIDLERLRGALLRRTLFPQTRSATQWV